MPSNSKQLKDVCLEHIDVYQTQGKGENKTEKVADPNSLRPTKNSFQAKIEYSQVNPL